MAAKTYTFLALGDSYTIGEGVALYETFSYQTIQLLRKAGHNFNAPEIIARTGWTTDDLKKGIRSNMFQSTYNFVSLLIGVNDQYQQKNPDDYSANFELLLKQSISFAGNNPAHVFVLSIPDWGQTPFATGKNRELISAEINAFNTINKNLTLSYKARYLFITDEIKMFAEDTREMVADQLHPSKKVYARWATQLSDEIQKLLV